MNLHCIGDSHCSFFLGYNGIAAEYPVVSRSLFPNTFCYRLGASLAYNADKYGTTIRSREKVEAIISNLNPDDDLILLSFGEIDCRAHILKQCEMRYLSAREVVSECVSNYFRLVDYLIQKGFKIIIWNAVYSANHMEKDHSLEYPYFGTVQQRNAVTELFNEELKLLAGKGSFSFLTITSYLIDPISSLTIDKYYYDSVHLNNKLFLKAIKTINSQFNGPIFNERQFGLYKLALANYTFKHWCNDLLVSCSKIITKIYGKARQKIK